LLLLLACWASLNGAANVEEDEVAAFEVEMKEVEEWLEDAGA
jgi:hypothetical protein